MSKAPHNNQLTPGADYQVSSIERAARDQARHAYLVCEQACAGNPIRLADLLFDQAKVMALTSSKLVEAGCIAIAHGKKGKPAP